MADETDGIAHDYRLVNINKLQQRLEDERDRRNNVSKKYHRGINIVNVIQNVLVVTSIGLNAIGLGLLSTIITISNNSSNNNPSSFTWSTDSN